MNKDLVYIVSGGRTGTKYFGELMKEFISDCYSVHEPDLVDPFDIPRLMNGIKCFGIWHMVFGRLAGRTGVRNLAIRKLSGEFHDEEQLIRIIRAHRDQYYDSIAESIIVESHYQWYALLDDIRQCYPNAKIVGVIRDPREWVASWMSYGSRYDMKDYFAKNVLGVFAQKRMTPELVGDKKNADEWRRMGKFERLCWEWRFVNERIVGFSRIDKKTSIFRFEDIFGDVRQMKKMIAFAATHENRSYDYEFNEKRLETHINSSKRDKHTSNWLDWPVEWVRYMDEQCGELMNEFGYGDEPEWQRRLMVGQS